MHLIQRFYVLRTDERKEGQRQNSLPQNTVCGGCNIWCTKRVKSTDTGRPVFQKYGSTRKNTGRPVNLRVDPYFRYGSTRIFAGRPVFLRIDPYFYGSTRIIRVDPYFCGSTRIFTGRPVFYGSTCIYGSTRNIRVDPYFTGRPVS